VFSELSQKANPSSIATSHLHVPPSKSFAKFRNEKKKTTHWVFFLSLA
jgi:hypothetical protein